MSSAKYVSFVLLLFRFLAARKFLIILYHTSLPPVALWFSIICSQYLKGYNIHQPSRVLRVAQEFQGATSEGPRKTSRPLVDHGGGEL